MKPEDEALWLHRAAVRAATRPAFLAWVLARYAELEKRSDDSLRQQWQLSARDWSRLQLCLRPRADAFLQDVTRIACAFHLDRGALAAVIRRVDAVAVLRANEQPGQAGSLLVARRREPKKGDPAAGEETDND